MELDGDRLFWLVGRWVYLTDQANGIITQRAAEIEALKKRIAELEAGTVAGKPAND